MAQGGGRGWFHRKRHQPEADSQNGTTHAASGSSADGAGALNAAPQGNGGSNGTHVITEGVKSALAQIAASTIHHHDEPPVAEEPEAPVEAPVERPKKPRKKRESAPKAQPPKTEKDMLLDSVLSALPEPKAPGQGRSRRRVTTAALTGTPVAHAPSED